LASTRQGLRALPDAALPHAWTRTAPARPVLAPCRSLTPSNLCFAWSTPKCVQASASHWK